MERTLAMFLKENPFDYDAEQLCRLKQEIDPGLRHLYNHLRKSKTSNRLYLSMI